MVYKTFLSSVTKLLQEKLGDDFTLSVRSIQKNNGVTLDGLTIQGTDITLAPTIFLNSYFAQLEQGMTMDEIVDDIIHLIQTSPLPPNLNEEDFSDFNQFKSKIMFRLIHTASNEELLTQIPNIPFMDLSIVFFLFLEQNENGQMTSLIYNSHMKQWDKNVSSLWSLARRNTPKEYPAKISNMSEVMKDIAKKNLGDDYNEEMLDDLLQEDEETNTLYVLTNQNGLYGASCILYPEVLKNFADYLGEDLIVLPSSIHEVLITPDSADCSYDELCDMVTSINQQEVPYEDQLSNQVYLYSRSENKMHIVSHGKDLAPLAK